MTTPQLLCGNLRSLPHARRVRRDVPLIPRLPVLGRAWSEGVALAEANRSPSAASSSSASSSRCGRCVSSSAAAAGTALGQRLSSEGSDGTEKLPQLSAKALGRLLTQPGALSEAAYDAALQCALQRIDEMDGKDCVRVLNALTAQPSATVAQTADEATLRDLGARLSERLDEVSLGDMSGLVENLSEAGLPALPIYARVSAAFSLRCSGATPLQLTQVAVAFSKARLPDRRLFPRLAQSSMKQIHLFKNAELPSFLAAFATVGISHEPLLLDASKVLHSRHQQMSAADLALVAFSYAQFFLVFPGIVNILRRRLPDCAHELSEVRLAELVVSCNRLRVKEPGLLTTFARDVKLSSVSMPLFAQVAKALAQLGLASSPLIADELLRESRERLRRLNITEEAADMFWAAEGIESGALDWSLELFESLGEACEHARRSHGGACPAFVLDAMGSMLPALPGLCRLLGARDVAALYRSLRQMPASLAGVSQLSLVHQALAERAEALVGAEAFGYAELTSMLYSQLCLYPDLWAIEDTNDGVNPQQVPLRNSFKALCLAWNQGASGKAPDLQLDPRTQEQEEVISLCLAPDKRTATNGKPKASRNRPVALELCGALRDLGYADVQQPFWEGPVEVHAAVDRVCFCLLPDDAYFKNPLASGAFSEGAWQPATPLQLADPTGSDTKPVQPGWAADEVTKSDDNMELCPEVAIELSLLRKLHWQPVAVACRQWRRLAGGQRSTFLAAALG
eukprot:TRINITY_DN74303_c0_g1_i1.p1 TRINITY_DN74303_c0_g1~~TRINITY_DN74303_c0_g1_i1.p1  ORF type:complete len:742 (-),score=146.17 TRINITY_DN74303_c0_g1_i1:55-2280(-)